MTTVPQITTLFNAHGSDAVFHREDGGTDCPCLTPTGDRDPKWHRDNPLAPVCNENGKLNYIVTDIHLKAFVQPIQSRGTMRLNAEYVASLFGEVQSDDHLGILPCYWNGQKINVDDVKQTGSDFVLYFNKRYYIVNVNTIPDPDDGNPEHHHELALRLVKNERPV